MTNQNLDDADEAMLAAVLSGDLAVEDPAVQRRRRESTAFAAELDALVGLRDDLERGGARVRRTLTAAQAEVDDRDVAAARAALSRITGAAASGPARRRWPVWLSAAAAVLFVAGAAYWAGSGSSPVQDTTLHSGDSTAAEWGMEPSGIVARAAFTGFRWRKETPPGGYWRVVVYRAEAGTSTGEPLVQAPEVDANSWQPDDRQRTLLLAQPAICCLLEPVSADGSTGRGARVVVTFSD